MRVVLTLIEVNRVPVVHVPYGAQILQRVIDKIIIQARIEFFVEFNLGLHVRLCGVWTRAPDADLVAYGHGDTVDPFVWRVRKEGHGPSIFDHVTDVTRILSKLGSVENVDEVIHEAIVVDLSVEIRTVYAEPIR
jgi:hypothetical protein